MARDRLTDADARIPLPELFALGVYVALTLFLMGRFLPHVSSFVPGSGPDPALNAWILAWDARALLHQPLQLFHANIFHPLPNSLAYSSHLLGLLPIYAPLAWLGAEPVHAYNLTWGLTFVLSASGMMRLVHDMTGRLSAGFLAGLLFAFGAYRITQLSHLTILATPFLPWALLYLRRFSARPSRRHLAVFGGLLSLQLLSGWYVAAFTLVILGTMLLLGPERRALSHGGLRAVLLASLVLLALVALPYVSVRDVLAERDVQTVARFSLRPLDLLTAREGHPLWHGLAASLRVRPDMNTERWAYVGLVAVALSVAGVLRSRRPERWAWAALACIGLALSAGPALHVAGRTITTPYGWVLQAFPALSFMRAAARWILLTHTALAVLAGLGWAAMLRRHSRLQAALVPLAALALLDAGAVPLHYRPLGPNTALHPVYHRLAAEEGDFAIVELPIYVSPQSEEPEAERVFASTLHWKRLVNGYSGVTPDRHRQLDASLDCFPYPEALQALASIPRLRYVVLHAGQSAVLDERWQRQAPRVSSHGGPLEPVGQWEDVTLLQVHADRPPPPQPALGSRRPLAVFQEGIVLETWSLDAEGGRLLLNWFARGRPATDYTVFVHLVDGDGQLLAQSDAWPGGGRYPTSQWCAGDRWEDVHDLTADGIPKGASLYLGLYRLDTGARLPILETSLAVRDAALVLEP